MPYSNKFFQISNNPGITFRILRYLSYKMQLNLELQVPQLYVSQYQTGYDSICILRYQSYKIQLNHELQIPQLYFSQYQTGYDSICILRYLPYKIQLKSVLFRYKR